MIEGRDIICFSNDWDGDPLSKKHIMTRLARKNRVLWVNSIGNRRPTLSLHDLRRVWKKVGDSARGSRSGEPNITVHSPLVLPFYGSRAARWFSRRQLRSGLLRVCRRLKFRDVITWTFAPSSADVAGTLGEEIVLYHCVDEFSEFDGVDRDALLEMERRLLAKAHLVVVSSSHLYESKSRHNPETHLVTHGVDTEHFRRACDPGAVVPGEVARLPRPVVGFFGLIAHWVDLRLIRHLATARPEWSFVLIGKTVADCGGLNRLANVHFLGRRMYSDLPSYCKGFDAAIVPFEVNELTLAANPLKLREYLAAGLPVVSTALPEAEKFSRLVRIARTYDEFLRHLDAVMAEGRTGPRLEASRSMEPESWDEKVEALSRLVSEALRAESRVRPSYGDGGAKLSNLADGSSLYAR
jgi:glycosyltransferase involved in cell wall biosynthesis